MGTNHFQREYIEYLQERNTDLLNKLSHLRENYTTKILSEDLSKHYLINALENVMSVCTALAEEIDLFFDKMTSAMEILQNLLLRKSEMVQFVEKITRTISPSSLNENLTKTPDSVKEQNIQSKTGKKVRVSPMINGHVILTEPRICLNRISQNMTPEKRSGSIQLSPIIEMSPESNLESSTFKKVNYKELVIPLKRINSCKLQHDLLKQESYSRLTESNTWKELQPNSDSNEAIFYMKRKENESNCSKFEKENYREKEKTNDPLEGPSWLYDEDRSTSPKLLSKSNNFVNFQRRRHRFASVFDKNHGFNCAELNVVKEKIDSPNINNSSQGKIKNKSRNSQKYREETSETFKNIINESFDEDKDCNSSVVKNFSSSRNCVEESLDESSLSNLENDDNETRSIINSFDRSDSAKSDLFLKRDLNESLSSATSARNSSKEHNLNVSIRRKVSTNASPHSQKIPELKSVSKFKNKRLRCRARSKKRRCSNLKKNEDESTLSGKEKQLNHLKDSDLKGVSPGKLEKRSKIAQNCSESNIVTKETESRERKRRKVAPLSLCEPKLNTKLRRK